MTGAPLVSVVMSVLNDERHVAATLDSILSQEGVDLEFIVIDDGSTDRTGEILDDYAARDPRLRVVHQENTGLTRALIRGCALARGKYIARQDGGGDVSLPGRLRTQMEYLESHPDIVMTSCGTRFAGPEGEELYDKILNGDELQRGLLELRVGPSHHGNAMFRRDVYNALGGYRSVFRVAQDVDLFIRMAEMGRCLAIDSILYKAQLSPHSLSSCHKREQLRTSDIIKRCALYRRKGLDEGELLKNCKLYSAYYPVPLNILLKSIHSARFYYHIGGAVRNNSPKKARAYYLRSIQHFPFFPKSWCMLLLIYVLTWQ